MATERLRNLAAMGEDEQDLIRAAQAGDGSALAMLLQKHYAFLLKYLTKITLHPELAQDITQETMLRCVEKIRLYNGKSKFSSWLITIATRLYVDEWRRKKREKDAREQDQVIRKLKWEMDMRGGQLPEALEALNRMPEDVRVPIVLKHYYGYELEEIAGMMDIPLGTVKSRIHNGLKSLRKELNDDES